MKPLLLLESELLDLINPENLRPVIPILTTGGSLPQKVGIFSLELFQTDDQLNP